VALPTLPVMPMNKNTVFSHRDGNELHGPSAPVILIDAGGTMFQIIGGTMFHLQATIHVEETSSKVG
jgi:hypothetical protein